MTDPTPAPSTPPTPPTSPYVAPAAGPKKALSLTSFIIGLAGVVLFFTSWFAILLGIAAVVLGFIGKAKEPGAPKWMWLIGVIAGFVAIVLGIIVIIVIFALAASLGNSTGY
jgi:hypothetical protein